jgi:hypothetical protein
MGAKRDVERGSLTTLNGLPITGKRAGLFNVMEARCLAIAEAHVNRAKHGISVRKVPFNANTQLLDEGIEWDQAYGTATAVIRGYTKAFRGDQLAFLKRSWSTTARRQDGTTAPAPSLPVEFQVPQDDFGQKTLLDLQICSRQQCVVSGPRWGVRYEDAPLQAPLQCLALTRTFL